MVQIFVLLSQNSLFDLLFLYKQHSPSVSHMFFCKDRQYGKEEMSGGWDMAPTIQCIQWRATRPCKICHFVLRLFRVIVGVFQYLYLLSVTFVIVCQRDFLANFQCYCYAVYSPTLPLYSGCTHLIPFSFA